MRFPIKHLLAATLIGFATAAMAAPETDTPLPGDSPSTQQAALPAHNTTAAASPKQHKHKKQHAHKKQAKLSRERVKNTNKLRVDRQPGHKAHQQKHKQTKKSAHHKRKNPDKKQKPAHHQR